MTRTTLRHVVGTTVVACAVVFGVAEPARAQVRTYEGDVIAVDLPGRSFTVRGTDRTQVLEMKFRIGQPNDVVVDGRTAVLAELAKGDHLVVSYASAGAEPASHHTKPVHHATREVAYKGTIAGIDVDAQTFMVRAASPGAPAERQFHVSPLTRLDIGGDTDVLLSQLRVGDTVTVRYEATDATAAS